MQTLHLGFQILVAREPAVALTLFLSFQHQQPLYLVIDFCCQATFLCPFFFTTESLLFSD